MKQKQKEGLIMKCNDVLVVSGFHRSSDSEYEQKMKGK